MSRTIPQALAAVGLLLALGQPDFVARPRA